MQAIALRDPRGQILDLILPTYINNALLTAINMVQACVLSIKRLLQVSMALIILSGLKAITGRYLMSFHTGQILKVRYKDTGR